MSKITNHGLTRYGTGCFTALCVTVGVKGIIFKNTIEIVTSVEKYIAFSYLLGYSSPSLRLMTTWALKQTHRQDGHRVG